MPFPVAGRVRAAISNEVRKVSSPLKLPGGGLISTLFALGHSLRPDLVSRLLLLSC